MRYSQWHGLAVIAMTLRAICSADVKPALLVPAYPNSFDEALSVWALTGHANRHKPRVWLNSSSAAPGMSVPVMWPYPEADATWVNYLESKHGFVFDRLADSTVCTLLAKLQTESPEIVSGLVMYDESELINAMPFLAATAAGLFDAMPATHELVSKRPCLKNLPVVFKLPDSDAFSTDIDAYDWAVIHLLANTSKKMQVGACRNWQNYTCGWGDPLGSAAIDAGIADRAFIHNLSPDRAKHPEQATMFARILSHLDGSSSIFTGWSEPEDAMIALLSPHGSLQLCGAPNLSFLRALKAYVGKLPYHRSNAGRHLDPSKHYVVFQSNEGDTPKNAYSFRGGNWLSPSRGDVPMAWGVDPLIAETFPGLWQYYVDTASAADQFFAATGGLGYTYPWSLPDKDGFFQRAGEAWRKYMPQPGNWVDLWEGGLRLDLYQRFRNISKFSVDGFSQQATGRAGNSWLPDGTPVLSAAKELWYPEDKGYCKKSDVSDMAACVERSVLTALQGKKPPFFILIYGQDSFVDVAQQLQARFASHGVLIVGTQDLADIARQAASRNHAAELETFV